MSEANYTERIIEKIKAAAPLDDALYQRLAGELERSQSRPGYDERERLKVLVFDAREYDIESLRGAASEASVALHFVASALDADSVETARGYKAICIFVNDSCDRAVIERLAALGVELIALRCAGYNNVDLEAADESGIAVTRVPEYSPSAVAEFTVGLMLNLNRHFHQAYLRNRASHFVLDGLTGFDMRGKTVGIVGTGRIGRCVAEILTGFGCRVIGYDAFPDPDLERGEWFQYVELDELWRDSEIITLHVPLFPETKYIVNADSIARMKPGVMLINTSRGGLVDTRALIEELKSGRIGAAGLDVYEEEAGIFFQDYSDRVLTDDVLARLLTFPNVIVTSHQAYLTREALANIARSVLTSIEDYRAGRSGDELSNRVRPPR